MTYTWFVIRGSGITAYVLLAAATVWGLLVSTKLLNRWLKPKGLTWFHESLGLAAVLATMVHLGTIATDHYIGFSAAELFVPGASSWRPMAVALGITAFYGLILVSGSFYVKEWIGQRAWRTVHYLSFGCFAAATTHGIMAGSDVGNSYVIGMYAAGTAAVGVLLALRVAQSVAVRQPASGSRTTTTAPPRDRLRAITMEPPADSAVRLAMSSPSPVPEPPEAPRRSTEASGKPGPASSITI
jgi:methionine sulfoxide reductase heme-binding subunit